MIERRPMRQHLRNTLLCLTATCTVAAAAQTRNGDASDRWAVDVSLGRCELTRTLTSPQPAQLAISTMVGTDAYFVEYLSAKPNVDGDAVGRGSLLIDGKTQATDYLTRSRTTSTLPSSLSLNTGRSAIDAIGAGSNFAFKSSVGSVGPLPLPNAAKAIAALHRCETDQLIEWGADPSQFAAGGAPPQVGDRDEWVSQNVMHQIHSSGRSIQPLHYLVMSDQGVVENCAAVFGVPNSDFEQVVCKAMAGRKLGKPARDPSGKAVRGVVAFEPAIIRVTAIDYRQ